MTKESETNSSASGEFHPERAYTIDEAARKVRRSARWFREKIVVTFGMEVARFGDLGIFPGWVFIRLIESNLGQWNDGPTEPTESGG